MQKKKEYFGIYLNDDIPKIDKKNKYSKEVKIKFEGKAFLIQRDKENEICERIEIENKYQLKKEKDYEIEFINNKNEIYYVRVRIETSCFLVLIVLFLFGIMLGLMLCRQVPQEDSWINKIYGYINLAMIKLDGKEEEKSFFNDKSILKYEFEKINPRNVSLLDTMDGKTNAKAKVAPGIKGHFSIVISTKNSGKDMYYQINFEDITAEKPNNMTFKIKGKTNQNYPTLQELESDLTGIIPKFSQKTIIIEWQWNYETGNHFNDIKENDLIDTNNGKILESYKFRINVLGEEVI